MSLAFEKRGFRRTSRFTKSTYDDDSRPDYELNWEVHLIGQNNNRLINFPLYHVILHLTLIHRRFKSFCDALKECGERSDSEVSHKSVRRRESFL